MRIDQNTICVFLSNLLPLQLEPLDAKMVEVVIEPESSHQLGSRVSSWLRVGVHHLPFRLLLLEDCGTSEPLGQVGLHDGKGDVPPLDDADHAVLLLHSSLGSLQSTHVFWVTAPWTITTEVAQQQFRPKGMIPDEHKRKLNEDLISPVSPQLTLWVSSHDARVKSLLVPGRLPTTFQGVSAQ